MFLDEIESLQMEVDILKHMAAIKAGKVEEEPVKKSRPFKPIIITQDKLQKEVYGMGYPSMPVLSVEEFYDQRVREGWFPPAGSGRALQVQVLKRVRYNATGHALPCWLSRIFCEVLKVHEQSFKGNFQ